MDVPGCKLQHFGSEGVIGVSVAHRQASKTFVATNKIA